jgi:hypothetical protein
MATCYQRRRGRVCASGFPEREVALAVLMVIANPFITGQTIGLNGGMLLG